MPTPASVLILALALVVAAIVYVAVFASFGAIERDATRTMTAAERAACRFESTLLAGICAAVVLALLLGVDVRGGK